MDNRDFKGVWIPKEMWLNEDLTFIDKIILVEIDSLDNENHCVASNDYLASFCQCSERKVSESIKKLCELGFIEVVSFDGRHRKIRSLLRSIAPSSMQSRKNCEAATQNLQSNNIVNNIEEDIDSISINRNTGISDFESHSYSKEELQSDFLGSVKKKKRTKTKSLYDKCTDEIMLYTKNISLQSVLSEYLTVRLAMKDKPMLGVNQWKGILNKLSEVSGETVLDSNVENRVKIVKQSIERGWASFFELKNDSSGFREDCAAFGPKNNRVVTVPTETTAEERAEELEKRGRRSKF